MQMSALLIMYALVTTLRALRPSRLRLRHLVSRVTSVIDRIRRHVAVLVSPSAHARRGPGCLTPPSHGSATRQPEGHHLAVAASRSKDPPLAAMSKDS